MRHETFAALILRHVFAMVVITTEAMLGMPFVLPGPGLYTDA